MGAQAEKCRGSSESQLVQRLTVQALLVRVSEGGHLFTLAEHLCPRFLPGSVETTLQKQTVTMPVAAGETTEQVDQNQTEQVRPLAELSPVQWAMREQANKDKN